MRSSIRGFESFCLSLALVSALLVGQVTRAQTPVAQRPATSSMVSFADLDLSQPGDLETLQKRISSAAKQVCRSETGYGVDPWLRSACVQRTYAVTIDKVIAQLAVHAPATAASLAAMNIAK